MNVKNNINNMPVKQKVVQNYMDRIVKIRGGWWMSAMNKNYNGVAVWGITTRAGGKFRSCGALAPDGSEWQERARLAGVTASTP